MDVSKLLVLVNDDNLKQTCRAHQKLTILSYMTCA